MLTEIPILIFHYRFNECSCHVWIWRSTRFLLGICYQFDLSRKYCWFADHFKEISSVQVNQIVAKAGINIRKSSPRSRDYINQMHFNISLKLSKRHAIIKFYSITLVQLCFFLHDTRVSWRHFRSKVDQGHINHAILSIWWTCAFANCSLFISDIWFIYIRLTSALYVHYSRIKVICICVKWLTCVSFVLITIFLIYFSDNRIYQADTRDMRHGYERRTIGIWRTA